LVGNNSSLIATGGGFDFTDVMKSTVKCIKYVLSHVIDYQHVSIGFAIIIGVTLPEYNEYNNLPYRILGTTQCYNKCIKHSVVPLTPF
jgi:hypothetical protein